MILSSKVVLSFFSMADYYNKILIFGLICKYFYDSISSIEHDIKDCYL